MAKKLQSDQLVHQNMQKLLPGGLLDTTRLAGRPVGWTYWTLGLLVWPVGWTCWTLLVWPVGSTGLPFQVGARGPESGGAPSMCKTRLPCADILGGPPVSSLGDSSTETPQVTKDPPKNGAPADQK